MKMHMALCWKCQQKIAQAYDVKPDLEVPAGLPKKCDFCYKANRNLKWFEVKKKGE